MDALEKAGDSELVPAAQRAWALDPSNEAGARRLIRFLDASVGRRAALHAYDELAGYLRRECEADPAAETQAFIREIRAGSKPQPPDRPLPGHTRARRRRLRTPRLRCHR